MISEARKKQIMDRIHADYKMLEGMGHTVLGVFLQGSTNYSLDYEGSDIDTKAIVLPSFEDFVMLKKPISTTHILPSNEHVDIKNITVMFETIKKQNINFVEILFTDYYYINPKFVELFQPILIDNELIARYNKLTSIKCMIGMAMEKRKALEHPYPSIIEKIEKFGYCSKQLHHILRMYDFMQKYINDRPYKQCLTPDNREYLIDIKRNIENGEIITVERARELADTTLEKIKELGNKYIAKLDEPFVNEKASQLIKDTTVSILREHFRNEILGERR